MSDDSQYLLVNARRYTQNINARIASVSARLLELEGDVAALQRLGNSVAKLHEAILDIAPRVSRMEEELRRLRGRMDSWGFPYSGAPDVHTKPTMPNVRQVSGTHPRTETETEAETGPVRKTGG